MQAEVAQRRTGGDVTRRGYEVDARRLRREWNRARRARIRLQPEDLPVRERELHVQQSDHAERPRNPPHDRADLRVFLGRQRWGRQHARRVTGMHAGFLDVLHDRADVGVLSIRDRVDVDLNRALDEAIDQNGAVDPADVIRRVADAHRTAPEHVRRTDQHGVADALRNRARLNRVRGDPPLRARDVELTE